MKKRIREFERSSGLEIYGLGKDRVKWEAAMEKFAELIVRECAQVCRDQPNIYALKADRDNCAIAIEQHFGVEG